MGHERVGLLPKTQRWRNVVGLISDFDNGASVPDIASKTLTNVRDRLCDMHLDQGVQAAFQFLVILSVAAKSANPRYELEKLDVKLPKDVTPLSLATALREKVTQRRESLEYAQIAQGAAADAIGAWYKRDTTGQVALFDLPTDPFASWRKASEGSGFCELSRLFFASLTARYLNYFLEREASAQVTYLREREQFSEQVRQHAFETSKITQSFAAGWFNKYAKEQIPSDKSVESFLRTALAKLGEELRLEGQRE